MRPQFQLFSTFRQRSNSENSRRGQTILPIDALGREAAFVSRRIFAKTKSR